MPVRRLSNSLNCYRMGGKCEKLLARVAAASSPHPRGCLNPHVTGGQRYWNLADGEFTTTSWSVILAAKEEQSAIARNALNTLCETYWYPTYSYIRHKGYSVEEAKDLAQGFFTRFLEKDYLKDVTPSKGKFRSFLLVPLNHFI